MYRRRPVSESTHDHERPHDFEGQRRFEWARRRPLAAVALLGAVAISPFAAYAGIGPALDRVEAYNQSKELDDSFDVRSGDAEVTQIDLDLKEECKTAFTTEVSGVNAAKEWKEGLFDKHRKVTIDQMEVESKFCQDPTTARIEVSHVDKKYHIYVDDVFHLDTDVQFGASPTESSSFLYSFSGSGSLIPEQVFKAFTENTNLTDLTLPGVFNTALDVRDSTMLSAAIARGEQDVRDTCGAKIAEVTEDKYKQGIIDIATNYVSTAVPDFEDYDVQVFIGDQTPASPDADIEYTFVDDLQAPLIDAKADGGLKIASGETGECTIADDVKIVQQGGYRE